jgi:twinkle protein
VAGGAPDQAAEDSEGQYPVATPYDISGSAHFFNKADACLSVWRNPLNDSPEVHVQKVRFAETGRMGMQTFRYDRPTGKFHET